MVIATQLAFVGLLIINSVNCAAVLDNNGYSGIVVTISEEIQQPPDGGLSIIHYIQVDIAVVLKTLFQRKCSKKSKYSSVLCRYITETNIYLTFLRNIFDGL